MATGSLQGKVLELNQADKSFGVACHQVTIRLVDCETKDPPFETFDLFQGGLGVHVPEADGAVPTASHAKLIIGRKSSAEDGILVPLQGGTPAGDGLHKIEGLGVVMDLEGMFCRKIFEFLCEFLQGSQDLLGIVLKGVGLVGIVV